MNHSCTCVFLIWCGFFASLASGQQPAAAQAFKVYIATDMEGCSGIASSKQIAAEEGSRQSQYNGRHERANELHFLEETVVQFLVLANVREGVSIEQVTSLVAEEAKVVWGMFSSGQVRSAHYRADIPGAVLMLEVPDLNEATKFVESLPMVQAGLLKTEIIPLEPYTGFEALFAS